MILARRSAFALFLPVLALGLGLSVGCGKQTGKAKLNKIKKADKSEQVAKTREDASEIFSAAIDLVRQTTSPVEIMQGLDKIAKDKFGPLYTESQNQAQQVISWNVFVNEKSLVITMDHASLGSPWLKLQHQGGGSVQVEDLLCARMKQTQETNRNAQKSSKANQGAAPAGRSKTLKCDSIDVTSSCLDESTCNMVLILVYNIDKNYILPIFHQRVQLNDISQEKVLPVPASVVTSLGNTKIQASAVDFDYTAMVLNENSQVARLTFMGPEGQKEVDNGKVYSYLQDQAAEVSIEPLK